MLQRFIDNPAYNSGQRLENVNRTHLELASKHRQYWYYYRMGLIFTYEELNKRTHQLFIDDISDQYVPVDFFYLSAMCWTPADP